MTELDAIAALVETHWDVRSPIRVSVMTTGVNNASYLIGHESGDFVLKQYRNVDVASRLPFEHALLQALADVNLPFDIPVPVPTVTGDLTAIGQDGYTFGLTRRIPGEPGWRGDMPLARRAGHALAILDDALATVGLPPRVPVPDAYPPIEVSEARIARVLGGDRQVAREVAGLLDRAERQMMDSTSGWPVQMIHTDYFPPNVLVEDGAISGVIDFEFAGSGHLAMDFAIGLVAFGTDRGACVPHLDFMDAFASGYFEAGTLSPEELAAMPVLLQRREAGSFAHWLGRMEDGLTSPDQLRERAQRLLDLDRWLAAHGDELVDALHRLRDHQR